MIRGTTPIHTFELPFLTEKIKSLSIAYAQRNNVLVRKTEEDCSLSKNTISVMLSQEDTLKFSDNYIVEIQIKVMDENGIVDVSDIMRETPEKVLDEVILE